MNAQNKDLLTILSQKAVYVNAKIDMKGQNVKNAPENFAFFQIVIVKLDLVDLDQVIQRDLLKSITKIKVGKVCVMTSLMATMAKPMLM